MMPYPVSVMYAWQFSIHGKINICVIKIVVRYCLNKYKYFIKVLAKNPDRKWSGFLLFVGDGATISRIICPFNQLLVLIQRNTFFGYDSHLYSFLIRRISNIQVSVCNKAFAVVEALFFSCSRINKLR